MRGSAMAEAAHASARAATGSGSATSPPAALSRVAQATTNNAVQATPSSTAVALPLAVLSPR